MSISGYICIYVNVKVSNATKQHFCTVICTDKLLSKVFVAFCVQTRMVTNTTKFEIKIQPGSIASYQSSKVFLQLMDT